MSDALTITESCAGRLRELLDDAGPEAGLRIDVVQGGCSGYQYRLALDATAAEDVVTETHGVRVFTDAQNLRFVSGSTVDHRADGFHIDNPNVVYGCGCGNSFLLRDEAEAIA